jgi:hypothetical protein
MSGRSPIGNKDFVYPPVSQSPFGLEVVGYTNLTYVTEALFGSPCITDLASPS